jgi:hypothetical protein
MAIYWDMDVAYLLKINWNVGSGVNGFGDGRTKTMTVVSEGKITILKQEYLGGSEGNEMEIS